MADSPGDDAEVGSHPLARLYYRSVLDPLVELARAVSHDFVRRPRRYKDIPEEYVSALEGFRIRSGADPDWLSASQRAAIFGALFGNEFHTAAITLRNSAMEPVGNMRPENEAAGLQTVVDSAIAFRELLLDVEGSSVDLADHRTAAVFESAFRILGSAPVALAFGVTPPAGGSERRGPVFAAEIYEGLDLIQLTPPLSQHRVSALQRVARYGAQVIDGVLSVSGEQLTDRAGTIARDVMGWERSLQELLITVDVVRAWKDPAYRQGLDPSERKSLEPHPSGEVSNTTEELARRVGRPTGGLGFSTMTVNAICCSTGDLPCTAASEGSDYCCPTNTGFTCPSTDCGSGCTILA